MLKNLVSISNKNTYAVPMRVPIGRQALEARRIILVKQLEQIKPCVTHVDYDVYEELQNHLSCIDQNLALLCYDPLIEYCGDNPDADECRVFDT